MWNHWNDVTKKLKNIAVEIATPHFEVENETNNNNNISNNNNNNNNNNNMKAHNTSVNYDGTRRRLDEALQQAAEEQKQENEKKEEKKQNLLNYNSNLEIKSTLGSIPPVRQAAVVEITHAMSPPSRGNSIATNNNNNNISNNNNNNNNNNISNNNNNNNNSNNSSLATSSHDKEEVKETIITSSSLVTNKSPAEITETTNNDIEITNNNNNNNIVENLQKQVQFLLNQKEEMEKQIILYQEEVSKTHQQTIAYYEQQIEALQQEIATEKILKQQFEEKYKYQLDESTNLKQEVETLNKQVKEIKIEINTKTAGYDKMKELFTNKERQYLEAIKKIESLQDAHDVLIEKAKENNLKISSSVILPSIPLAKSDEFMNNNNNNNNNNILSTTPAHESTINELKQRLEKIEKENLIITSEKEKLFLLLQEEQKTHRAASAEKDELLFKSREQAKKLSELVERLESERHTEKIREEEKRLEVSNQNNNNNNSNKEEDETTIKLQEEIAKLNQQLKDTQNKYLEMMEESKTTLQAEHAKEISNLTQQHSKEMQSTMHKLQNELNEANKQIKELNTYNKQLEEEKEKQPNEKEKEKQQQSTINALTTRRRELENELLRTREIMQQLEHTITDCIIYNNNNIELPPAREDITSSFSDKISLLVSEFHRILNINQQAQKLQKEWEHTYEQARSVNATLTLQVNEAWKTIGNLREDISIKEQTISKLKQQIQAEAQRYRDTQHTLANLTNEIQILKEERKSYETQIVESSSGEMNYQEQIIALNSDIETLKKLLHDREEELIQAQRSLDNLQHVLNTFTQNKNRDIEERTADMQIEIDQLRTQLLENEKQQNNHQSEINNLITSHRKELANKNLEITSLHRKHAELRKALDETARQLNGDNMIDKRVISHLIVNYIHAFIGERREADEMLKVLSGLLNWDELMQEKAGLLPGPTNPKPGKNIKRTGIIGGFVNSVWGNKNNKSNNNNNNNNNNNTGPSIAELWVEFLMKESETGVREVTSPVTSDVLLLDNNNNNNTISVNETSTLNETNFSHAEDVAQTSEK